jgi:hypothetical protein
LLKSILKDLFYTEMWNCNEIEIFWFLKYRKLQTEQTLHATMLLGLLFEISKFQLAIDFTEIWCSRNMLKYTSLL